MKLLSNAIKIASVILGLTAPMTSAFADQGNLQPWQLPMLAAEWGQWAFSIPAPANPVLDTTGEQCMVGQRGPIWFLAGAFLGGSATRSCSVPAGEALFFPIINAPNISIPKDVCGSTGIETAKELRADIKPFIDAAQNIEVTVDGRPIKKAMLRRVQSEVFYITLPADNVFLSLGFTPCPAAVYSPAVDDGYYASVGPLSLGPHTIHFQAQSGGFIEDVTYNLTVVPVSLK